MNRYYYSDPIPRFLERSPDEILRIIATNNDFSLELTQKDAWIVEIGILQKALAAVDGTIRNPMG